MNHGADPEGGAGGGGGGRDPASQQNFFSFMPGQNPAPQKHPRNENFFDMWKYTFCPNFKCLSAIVFICIIQLIFFMAEIIHTAVVFKELNNMTFIGVQLPTL